MAALLIPQALCSLDDVKAALSADIQSDSDSLLAIFINGFSYSVERRTGRLLELKERDFLFDVGAEASPGGPTTSVQVAARPIAADSVTVNDDPSGEFDEATELVEREDYVVDYQLGIIRRAGFETFDAGQRSTSQMGASFKGGPQSLKVTLTGGLVTPRADGDAAPTVTATGSSGITGTHRYLTTTVDGEDNESAKGAYTNPIVLAAQAAHVVFPNPGSGASKRIFRTKNGAGVFYYLASVSGTGGGGSLSYDDTFADGLLDTTVTPPGEGPLVVPADLRLAAIMQVGAWWKNRGDFSLQAISINDIGSSRFFDPTAFLPQVKEIVKGYCE